MRHLKLRPFELGAGKETLDGFDDALDLVLGCLDRSDDRVLDAVPDVCRGGLTEESSFYTSIGNPFPAVCIRTSTERPEALDKACFVLAGIDGMGLEQAVEVAVSMNENGDYGIPVPDYIEENVSTKVVKIIQSYTGVVNKMVWRKY